jgi:plastocyanin
MSRPSLRRAIAVLAVAGVVAAAGGCAADPARNVSPDAVTMDDNLFQPKVKQIAVGDTLTFANTSPRALHILVLGDDAQDTGQDGAPSFGGSSGERTEVGDVWTTAPWDTPGTYSVTCTLHPNMNLEVIVG